MELEPEDFQEILPLPLTVITTVDEDGVPNAAPYGCVMPVLKPLNLIALASAIPRDTLQNIRATGEFVINVMGKPAFRESMQCAKDYPTGVNEMEEVGLEAVPAKEVKPPRVKAAIGWIEAEFEQEMTGDDYAIVLGKVVQAEFNEQYVEGEEVAETPLVIFPEKFRSLSNVKFNPGEEK